MINAWKLHGEAPRKPAWANLSNKDPYANGGSVTNSAPFGISPGKTDYSTSLRP